MKLRCTNPTLLLYLAWVYALPVALNTWLSYESDIYVNPSNGIGSWLYAGLLFFITAAFAFRIEWQQGPRPVPVRKLCWMPVKLIVTILTGVLLLATLGVPSTLSRWRYSGEGLSESLDLMSLLFVLAPNVLELILFALLFFHCQLSSRTMRVMLLMLTVDLVLTASGIGPMLGVLLASTSAIAPDIVRRVLLRPDRPMAGTSNLRRLIWLLPLFGCLGVLAYLVGYAIKQDVSLTEALDTQDAPDVFMQYLVGRISVQWYSLVAALHQYVEVGDGGTLQNLMAPLTNAGFRFSSLLGGWLGIERPLDGSLARINYGLINLYPINDREGTTPGLIATFVLICPVWLGPFALAGYLWIYDKIQAGLRSRFAGQPTIFGELLLLYFTAVFFSSPADFLLVFDPMLLSLVVWCYLGLSAKSERPSHGFIEPR